MPEAADNLPSDREQTVGPSASFMLERWPLEDDMPNGLISCDDHMDLGQLPADLWETRLPAALRARAPHIEERDGQAMWICDGKVWGRWDGKSRATGSARPIKPIYTALDRA